MVVVVKALLCFYHLICSIHLCINLCLLLSSWILCMSPSIDVHWCQLFCSRVLLDDPEERPNFTRILGHLGLRQGNEADFLEAVSGFILAMGILLEDRGAGHDLFVALLQEVVGPLLSSREHGLLVSLAG